MNQIGYHATGHTPYSPTDRLVGALAFVFALVASLAVAAMSGPLRTPVLILCLSGSISFGALFRSIAAKDTNPIQFTSHIYLVFFFTLPAIIHVGSQRYPYNMIYPEWAETTAGIAVLVFTVGLVAGARIGQRRLPKIIVAPQQSTNISATAIYASIFATMLLSVASALVVGYAVIRVNRGEAAELFDAATPFALVLSALATNGSFVAFAIALLNVRQMGKIRGMAAVTLVLTSIVFLLGNNILALPRFVIGAYAITLFFALAPRGPRLKLALLAGLVVAQFTIFPLLSEVSRGGGLGAYKFDPLDYLATHGDFDGFQSTINVVLYTAGGGFLLGKQLLSALLFFVPRYLFPSKSIGLGGDSATFVGYSFINISSPLPSEFYADFGLIGVVVLAPALGWAIVRMDRRYQRAAMLRNSFELLPPAIIAGYSFIILRGSLVGVLGPVVVTVALARINCFFIGRTARK